MDKTKPNSGYVIVGDDDMLVQDRDQEEKIIGLGSNGSVVYEGTYEGHKAAVKRHVTAHFHIDKEKVAILLVAGNHQNIIRLYGYKEDPDFTYLSMERCNDNLYDLVRKKMHPELWRSDEFPTSKLLKLMKDIVAGLAHLHSLGLVHQDLKPSHVLIVKERGLCPKLSGIGCSTHLAVDMSSLGPNARGTSGWRAPELIIHGQQTAAMDVFSLGCVLFFCLTQGEHPFGDIHERDMNVTNNNIVNLILLERIPEAENLISQLLNPNPEVRPKASEVLIHPLFWNSETRMLFMKETSDWVESKDKKANSSVLEELESKGCVAFLGTWDGEMDPAFLSQMTQRREYLYRYDMVVELLCIIQNTMNYYNQLPTDIQKLLGAMPEGVDDYFRNRFPKLLMEVYNVMHYHCKEEGWFLKYLEN